MLNEVFCRKCNVFLDYEDLNDNWCPQGNHSLLPERDDDYAQVNERCLVW